MKFKNVILSMAAMSLIAATVSCDDDDPVNPDNNAEAEAGEISGGPFTFYVDGKVDNIAAGAITLDSSSSSGSNSSWVITDAEGKILGLPPTLEAVSGVDFDEAGVGTCLIWYARWNGEPTGIAVDGIAEDIEGDFDLSNSITVNRLEVTANAGEISGGPFIFNSVSDGTPDTIGPNEITLDDSNAVGENSTWVITKEDGEILGFPASLEAVEMNDFDGAGPGVCLIWYARWDGEITGNEIGNNASEIRGNFALSNSLTVNRTVAATP